MLTKMVSVSWPRDPPASGGILPKCWDYRLEPLRRATSYFKTNFFHRDLSLDLLVFWRIQAIIIEWFLFLIFNSDFILKSILPGINLATQLSFVSIILVYFVIASLQDAPSDPQRLVIISLHNSLPEWIGLIV